MHTMRVLIPSLITAIVGLVLVAAIFIPANPFATLDREFSTFFDIVAAFAFICGPTSTRCRSRAGARDSSASSPSPDFW